MLIDESRNAASYSNGPSVGRRTPTEIVIHHWGADGQTHDGVVNFFCTTAPTSAHFVVSAGRIHCLVNLTDVAWHAGDWDVNLRSIGIECRPEATNADYAAVAWLVQYLRGLYGNLPLTPHKKYAQTACPGRYDLARINKEASGAPSPTPATKPQSATITPIPSEEDDMFTDNDKANLETTLGRVTTLVAMLDNVANAVTAVPGRVLDKQVPRANSKATTSLGLFLSYADADREATISRIKGAIESIPAADLAAQIDAAGIATEVRDELVKLLGGTK